MNPEIFVEILSSLHKASHTIRASAIISRDGLVLAATLPPGLDMDKVGAMGAAIVSIGIRTAAEWGVGQYGQMLLEGEQGRVLAIKAGEEAVILAFIEPRLQQLEPLFLAAHSAAEQVNACMERGRV